MDTDIIKTLIYAEEFYPFRIFHKKGRVYDVPARDFAWVSPVGVFLVEESDSKRSLHILNPAMIEKIQTHEEAQAE